MWETANNATVNETPEEKKRVGLASPWTRFFKEVAALFAKDPDVDVIFNGKTPEIKLLVNDQIKANALSKIFPQTKKFGNVELKITVVPANAAEEDPMELFRKAFYGNEAVQEFIQIKSEFGLAANYIVFIPEVVQYWADNMGNPDGFESTLYENIAKDVFDTNAAVFFTTGMIEEE